jgi:hypothetical protein
MAFDNTGCNYYLTLLIILIMMMFVNVYVAELQLTLQSIDSVCWYSGVVTIQ